MDFASLPLFNALTRKMSWLAAREKLLAQNVANANTPGYHATDLRPLEFGKELNTAQARLELATTSAAHLPGGGSITGLNASPYPAVASDTSDMVLDGNTVSLEDEMIKVSDNASTYQMITGLYKKQMGMFKEALGQGAGAGG